MRFLIFCSCPSCVFDLVDLAFFILSLVQVVCLISSTLRFLFFVLVDWASVVRVVCLIPSTLRFLFYGGLLLSKLCV